MNGACKLESKCAFERAEKARTEPKRRKNSVVVAQTLDQSYHINSKRRETFCTRCQRFQRNQIYEIGKNIDKKFRLSRVTERFVKSASEERCNFGFIYNKVDEAVDVRTLCRTSNSEVVQMFI